jgi:NADH-quinone oxidoreductase subunit A
MEYIPVLILMAIGATIGGAAVLVSSLLGPKIKNVRKDQPFECGVPGFGDTHRRVSVRFYLVAILFLLFDVEAVFFFPWAVVFREYLALGTAILWSMSFFVAILLVGYWYVLRKGALEWD